MKKLFYIGIVALMVTGCASTQQAPLDDAYYWPDNRQSAVNYQSSESSQTSEVSIQKAPTMEYVNVQDTTITVKIKR